VKRRSMTGSALAVTLAVLVYGCGGAQRAEAPAATVPGTQAPAGSVMTVVTSPSPPPPPAPPPEQPSPVVPPPPPAGPQSAGEVPDPSAARRAARADLDRAQRELEVAVGSCDTACRALASMERATAHLCSLADGPDDRRRCEDARQRLTSAQGRVRSACGACP
jgi:hypothetical protein